MYVNVVVVVVVVVVVEHTGVRNLMYVPSCCSPWF